MATTLSKDDIQRLLEDSSPRAQIEIIEKMTEHYAAEGENAFTPQEKAIAHDIFRLILTNATVTVRALLAMNLSQTDKLPKEIAEMIVNDVSEVACPMLQFSEMWEDKDLVAIIDSMIDTDKLRAIAKRDHVSENLSEALVNTSIDPVVSDLVKNEGAQISDQTFDKIATQHAKSEEVLQSLLQRKMIPMGIIEKVISHLSHAMKQNLESKYGDLHRLAEVKRALAQSLELTSLQLAGFKSTDEELMRVLKKLGDDNKLSPFTAISMGNLQLFEVSMSRMLHVPLKNIQTLLQDEVGFKLAYMRADLPETLMEATALAIRSIRELEQESSVKTIPSTDRVIQRMRELSKGTFIKGANHLYAMMQHCAHN